MQLSAIEDLPAELTQRVFFYCLNPQLTRASHFIGMKLSDEYIYDYVCSLAFPRWLRGLTELGDNELVALQRGIITSRWLTLEHLQKAEQSSFLIQLSTKRQSSRDSVGGIPKDPRPVDASETRKRSDGLGLPRRLLRGPWSSGDVKLLEKLINWGVQLRWDANTGEYAKEDNLEIASEGIYQAIRQGRPDLIDLLARRLGVEITTEMLQFAVIDLGCEKTVVQKLLQILYNFRQPTHDDAYRQVYAHAIMMKERDGRRGLWLWSYLDSEGRSYGEYESRDWIWRIMMDGKEKRPRMS